MDDTTQAKLRRKRCRDLIMVRLNYFCFPITLHTILDITNSAESGRTACIGCPRKSDSVPNRDLLELFIARFIGNFRQMS